MLQFSGRLRAAAFFVPWIGPCRRKAGNPLSAAADARHADDGEASIEQRLWDRAEQTFRRAGAMPRSARGSTRPTAASRPRTRWRALRLSTLPTPAGLLSRFASRTLMAAAQLRLADARAGCCWPPCDAAFDWEARSVVCACCASSSARLVRSRRVLDRRVSSCCRSTCGLMRPALCDAPRDPRGAGCSAPVRAPAADVLARECAADIPRPHRGGRPRPRTHASRSRPRYALRALVAGATTQNSHAAGSRAWRGRARQALAEPADAPVRAYLHYALFKELDDVGEHRSRLGRTLQDGAQPEARRAAYTTTRPRRRRIAALHGDGVSAGYRRPAAPDGRRRTRRSSSSACRAPARRVLERILGDHARRARRRRAG